MEDEASGLPTTPNPEWTLPFESVPQPMKSGQPSQSVEGDKEGEKQMVSGIALVGSKKGYPINIFLDPRQSVTLSESYPGPKIFKRISKVLGKMLRK